MMRVGIYSLGLLALLTIGVGVFFLLRGATQQDNGQRPVEPPPLPISADRDTDDLRDEFPSFEEPVNNDTFDTALDYAPGSTYTTETWQQEYMRMLEGDLQVLPLSRSSYPVYYIQETKQFRALMMVRETGYAFDVLLKAEPLYESRMYAEASIAQAMGIERVDLCGFPTYIYVDEPHELATEENLGLAFCGADKLNWPE